MGHENSLVMSSEIYRIGTALYQVPLKFSFIVPTRVKSGGGGWKCMLYW